MDEEYLDFPDLSALISLERLAWQDLRRCSSPPELLSWEAKYLAEDAAFAQLLRDFEGPPSQRSGLEVAIKRVLEGLAKARENKQKTKKESASSQKGQAEEYPDLTPLLILERRARQTLKECDSTTDLEAWASRYLGERGEFSEVLARIGRLTSQERAGLGVAANRVKEALERDFSQKKKQLREEGLAKSLSADALDVTLPGRAVPRGRLHIATATLREIAAIFADLGFQIYRSREVEDDLTNFELLNMPPHHPARDMWDTFHTTTPGVLLRTHTSPGQIHVMRQCCPEPIRVILPGMCYRYEAITTRSEIMFHQVEGLAVGEHVTMTDLKGTIVSFARRLFGEQRQVRIRSSYFPFTEPSIEVDMDCIVCAGKGCSLCKRTGWLEIMGAGMVHPIVLQNGGYDPARFSGFAFGMGPQRISMLKYAIDDIRLFWGNDLRFLSQF